MSQELDKLRKLNKKLSESLVDSKKKFDAEVALRSEIENNMKKGEEYLEQIKELEEGSQNLQEELRVSLEKCNTLEKQLLDLDAANKESIESIRKLESDKIIYGNTLASNFELEKRLLSSKRQQEIDDLISRLKESTTSLQHRDKQ